MKEREREEWQKTECSSSKSKWQSSSGRTFVTPCGSPKFSPTPLLEMWSSPAAGFLGHFKEQGSHKSYGLQAEVLASLQEHYAGANPLSTTLQALNDLRTTVSTVCLCKNKSSLLITFLWIIYLFCISSSLEPTTVLAMLLYLFSILGNCSLFLFVIQ